MSAATVYEALTEKPGSIMARPYGLSRSAGQIRSSGRWQVTADGVISFVGSALNEFPEEDGVHVDPARGAGLRVMNETYDPAGRRRGARQRTTFRMTPP